MGRWEEQRNAAIRAFAVSAFASSGAEAAEREIITTRRKCFLREDAPPATVHVPRSLKNAAMKVIEASTVAGGFTSARARLTPPYSGHHIAVHLTTPSATAPVTYR